MYPGGSLVVLRTQRASSIVIAFIRIPGVVRFAAICFLAELEIANYTRQAGDEFKVRVAHNLVFRLWVCHALTLASAAVSIQRSYSSRSMACIMAFRCSS
jgi:hypothetical protein